jgi:hypothetical protein
VLSLSAFMTLCSAKHQAAAAAQLPPIHLMHTAIPQPSTSSSSSSSSRSRTGASHTRASSSTLADVAAEPAAAAGAGVVQEQRPTGGIMRMTPVSNFMLMSASSHLHYGTAGSLVCMLCLVL